MLLPKFLDSATKQNEAEPQTAMLPEPGSSMRKLDHKIKIKEEDTDTFSSDNE